MKKLIWMIVCLFVYFSCTLCQDVRVHEYGHVQPKESDCDETTTTRNAHPTVTHTTVIPTTKSKHDCLSCCEGDKKKRGASCKEEKQSRLTPTIISASLLLMKVGVYLMAAGFPSFRLTMSIVGLILGGYLSWIGLQSSSTVTQYPDISNLNLGLCCGVGVIAGLSYMMIYKFAMYCMCVVAAGLVTIYSCSWQDNFTIPNIYYRSLLGFGIVILFILGYVFLETLTVHLSLAFTGAYIFILGLDLMVDTGFRHGLAILSDFNQARNSQYYHHVNSFTRRGIVAATKGVSYHVEWKVQSMLGAVIGLTILSMTWQRYMYKGKRFGLCIVLNSNDTLNKN
ncbi:MAG: hypothetical protein EXX96DRAFT_571181 [Benjaminiella poitrasii]|nr:MAG: hypothetical protein EXX96DRAFT_571181 [Benjaminiella poitrasii]